MCIVDDSACFSEIGLEYKAAPEMDFQLPYAISTSMFIGQLDPEFLRVVKKKIGQHGAVLLRGAQGVNIDSFMDLINKTTGSSLNYDYGSTPRSKIQSGLYTATEYPAHQTIPLHNEQSYTNVWADYLWFYCEKAALSGGETTLADSRLVYKKIPKSIRDRFIDKGIKYVRNYGTGYDLEWQQVFNTEKPSEVERFCRQRDISFEWLSDGGLRTAQVCQAHIIHKETGAPVWFNQAHLFHVSSLNGDIRDALVDILGYDGLPRNAYYGDGTEIEDSVLDEIRSVYDEYSVVFPWHSGDIMLVDNVLTSHGRQPFEGPRKVYVAMT